MRLAGALIGLVTTVIVTAPAAAIAVHAVQQVSVAQRVKHIVINQLGADPASVVPNARFVGDLGADSLDIVELIMAFEEEFGIRISDAEATKIQTVGEAIAYITTSLKV